MSNALDDFERSLVHASRVLSSQATVTALPTRPAGVQRRRGGTLRRLRALSLTLRIAGAAAVFSLLTGGALAAYLVISNNHTKTLATFGCDISGNATAFVPAVTGDPVIDCAAAWPSASGGQRSAPPLTVWGTTSGREVAVARPTALGPEPSSKSYHWKKLPAGWTVDLSTVEITDQLSNIAVPFNGGTPDEACTRIQPDEHVVRSLLNSDGLGDWSIAAHGQVHGGPVSRTACRNVIWIVNGATRNITLLQPPASRPAPAISPQKRRKLRGEGDSEIGVASPPTPKESRADIALTDAALARQRKLKALYRTVNATLSRSCRSVQAAARLWTTQARAAGFTPTTLAYWHQLNTRGPKPSTTFDRYTLFLQPSSQHTGRCAHVLVMIVGGSGIANVYAARIPT